MSLRAVDSRFLLPTFPSTATVDGLSDHWSAGFVDAQVPVSQLASGICPDVAVVSADPDLVRRAVGSGAESIIAVGAGAAALLRRDGMHTVRYAVVPDSWHPEFLVPLDQPATMRYFIDHVRVSPRLLEWEAKRLAVRVLPPDALLRGRWGELVVATRRPHLPAVCEAASDHLGRRVSGWLARLGPPNGEGRVVFSLLEDGSRAPSLVAKLRRLPGGDASPKSSGGWPPVVGARAPRSVGTLRLEHGYVAHLESAASGLVMKDFLQGPFRTATKRAWVDRVAAWTVEVGRLTRRHPERSGAPATVEQRASRFAADKAPGARFELDWPQVPTVFEHGDLWTRNVVLGIGSGDFSVVDWDDADRSGLPLRDLVMLLADSYADIDGAGTQEERDDHFVELLSGKGAHSGRAFGWIAQATESLAIPSGAAGPLIALGLADLAQRRLDDLEQVPREIATTLDSGQLEPVVRRAELWLTTPTLGPSWQLGDHPAAGNRAVSGSNKRSKPE